MANGAVASGTIIDAGGVEEVASGGTTDNTSIAGGQLVLAGGAIATTQIDFTTTGGTLTLADDENFHAPYQRVPARRHY